MRDTVLVMWILSSNHGKDSVDAPKVCFTERVVGDKLSQIFWDLRDSQTQLPPRPLLDHKMDLR